MDNENEFNYSPSNQFKKVDKPKKSRGFGKTVFVPFLSGVVGAALVVGVCFGVPSVKEALFGNDSSSNTSYSVQTSSSSTTTAVNIADYSETASSVAQAVLPSIVGIEVNYSVSSIFGSSEASATGSGIIISEDGYIITNNHVIDAESSSSSSYYQITDATSITVTLYDSDVEYEATIVGTDSYTDLAVIKIDASGLTPATLGDSDTVQVGEFVMAIGNPLGMDFTCTAGIVSAVDREVTDDSGTTYTAIQTDAAINSGNSGGALVNANGEVIGINTLKLSGTGIEGVGFAIPINSTTNVVSQLIEYSTVKRPYIGISGITIDESTANLYSLPVGISVQSVEAGSPAEEAGIQAGDVITAIEGQTVESITELNKIKYTYEIGDTVTLTIIRNGSEMQVAVVLGEEPEEEEETTTEEADTSTQSNSNSNGRSNSDNNNGSSGNGGGSSIWDMFR